MSTDSRISDLLLRWEERRDLGDNIPAVVLCRDCPELLPEVTRRIAALQAMDPLLFQSRARVALVQESAPNLSREIQTLLRSRLRLASVIFLAGCVVSLLFMTFHEAYGAGLKWIDNLPYVLLIPAVAALIGLLSSRPGMSMARLRRLELILVGSAMSLFAWEQVRWLQSGWLNGVAQEGREQKIALLTGDSLSLSWFALIVVYGTYIPNTWRRCGVIVSAMAVTPLLLILGMGLHDVGLSAERTLDVFLEMAIWMAFAAAIAIYGCHKTAELRQEAIKARQLGQYHLKERIGAGGMGEVYRAEHQLLRRPCAIKLIRPERAGDASSLRRFEREVQAMATLTHWNTVEIYDYGHAPDGTFYYVMEYLPGLSLQELVDRHGPLPAERAVLLRRQVSLALPDATSLGVIHRDIKPGNIIVCKRGQIDDVVKLLDFGLVRPLNVPGMSEAKLTMEGTLVGTPMYMSPEQAAGRSTLDVRGDLYSLGAVGYFLLTGQAPFCRTTVMELLVAHLRDPVPAMNELRPDIPSDVQDVILRCLEKDPAQRFPDAAELEQALAHCHCAASWTPADAARWWEHHSVANVGTNQFPLSTDQWVPPASTTRIGDDAN
jgi:serine/threonine-protein kinase